LYVMLVFFCPCKVFGKESVMEKQGFCEQESVHIDTSVVRPKDT